MAVRIAPLHAALEDRVEHFGIEALAIVFENQRCAMQHCACVAYLSVRT